MKQLLSILVFILTASFAVAQCPDSDKLKFGGTMGTDSYIPATSTIQYFSYDMDTLNYCCHINKILKYAEFIIPKAEKYIKKRAGINFYNRLVFHDIMVIYHDYSVIKNFDSIQYNLEKCGRITYWLTYSYFKDSTIEYGFGIEFDSNGKKISGNLIPNISKNQKFMNIIGLCSAIELVKKQKVVQLDSIKSIELNYDDKINSFIWLVEEAYPETEGAHEQNLLFINANTGKLYKTEKNMFFIET
jgi:hypothetical protein